MSIRKKQWNVWIRSTRNPHISTLVVLPTGSGKTYTASLWLLKNALDQGKKILWIAHRQMLLEQVASSFQNFAYAEVLPHISSFRFRIISGSASHDRTSDISSPMITFSLPARTALDAI